jgi:hypothetical protein
MKTKTYDSSSLFDLILEKQVEEANRIKQTTTYMGKYIYRSGMSKTFVSNSDEFLRINFHKAKRIHLIEYNNYQDTVNGGLLLVKFNTIQKCYEFLYKEAGFRTKVIYRDKEQTQVERTMTERLKLKEVSTYTFNSSIIYLDKKYDIVTQTDCKRLGERWKIKVDYLKYPSDIKR